MTDRPKLYPGHRHQWADADPQFFHAGLVRCTVCGFQAPRNAAGLDGVWSEAYGQGRDDEAAGLPLRDNPHEPQPEQESKPA